MNKTEKTPRLSLTYIESQLIKELISIAPEVQITLNKLIKSSYHQASIADMPKINNLGYLLSEFAKRPEHKKVIPVTNVDTPVSTLK